MAKIESVKDLPEWFDIKKYEACESFGALEWFDQLAYRKEILICNPWFPDAMPDDNSGMVGSDAYVWRLRMSKLAPPLRAEPASNLYPQFDYLGLPDQQPVSSMCLADLVKIARQESIHPGSLDSFSLTDYMSVKGDSSLPEIFFHAPAKMRSLYPVRSTKEALLVDMAANDSVLIEAFRNWLKRARASQKLAPQGRSSLYARWARYGVLPYLDLLMWSMEVDVHIPRHVMAAAVSHYNVSVR